MAPLRWSRSDILWVMVVVVLGIICAGVCCEDVVTGKYIDLDAHRFTIKL